MQISGIMTDGKFLFPYLKTNIQIDFNFEAFLYSVLKSTREIGSSEKTTVLRPHFILNCIFFGQILTWALYEL